MLIRGRWFSLVNHVQKRTATCGGGGMRKALLLGAYDGCKPGEFRLTKGGAFFDDSVNGKISLLLKGTGMPLGKAQIFSNLTDEFAAVAVTGLGEEGLGYDSLERMDMCKENIRIATGVASKKLYEQGMNNIFVDTVTSGEPAAEGASLATWMYQDLKTENRVATATIEMYEPGAGPTARDDWEKGMFKAEAQNLARYLEEVPANLMTPTIFAENAIEALCPCGAQVDVHDYDWIESKRMGAILSMARTTCEPPMFLELKYCGGNLIDKPVVLVGQGITFDTGGLCPKPCEDMPEHRADLAGAAVVMATLRCAARLALPLNIIGLVPLCEHLYGGMAIRPGDVVIASNGKSIRIVDPNNEPAVMMADALAFSAHHMPCLVISVSTLTRGMKSTIGSGASGVFCNSHEVWWEMDRAGSETGDRFWRFPNFWKAYRRKVTGY